MKFITLHFALSTNVAKLQVENLNEFEVFSFTLLLNIELLDLKHRRKCQKICSYMIKWIVTGSVH